MLKLAAIFKDGMILQRNSKVRVWGESDGEQITLKFDGNTYAALPQNNKWFIDVITASNKESLSMTIISSDKNSEKTTEQIVINDILLGEVWLAGGQSNMELELQNSLDGLNVIKTSNYSKVRFYNVPKCAFVGDELFSQEGKTCWKKASDDSIKDVSAVAYYFAIKLYENLEVPIGIIDCYWGGTSATCWVSEKKVDGISKIKDYLLEWKDACENKSEEQYNSEMEKYNIECEGWNRRVEELKKQKPAVSWSDINEKAGACPWPQPKGKKSPFRPFGLHESMIMRVAPYKINGIIYYQGEEDAERAECYSRLNSAVISQWRQDFSAGEVEEIPFILTQLPMYMDSGSEDDKSWCVLRKQQEKCCNDNSNVSMAVLIDCGEIDNIHPIEKKTPGERLAKEALKLVYGKSLPCYMSIKKAEFLGNKCVLEFDNTYGNICYKKFDGRKLTFASENIIVADNGNIEALLGFEISDNDREFYSPKLCLDGEKLVLEGNEKSNLTSVRYGWFNYGVANIYNKEALPLKPFCIKKGK